MTAMAAMVSMSPPGPGQPETKFGSFATNPPGPFLDQIEGLAKQVAGEAAIPPHYLGMLTNNAASAEAIKNIESRLVKRTERRQTTFGWSWTQVGRMVLAARGLPTGASAVWRAADTPTVAAEADAVVKMVAAGVLPAASQVTWDRLRISRADQARLEADFAKAAGPVAALASSLARQDGGGDVKTKADAMGVLIRAGVAPASAAERVGLDGVEFTGAVPVSLRLPEAEATKLEG